jgi:hypothetical protein
MTHVPAIDRSAIDTSTIEAPATDAPAIDTPAADAPAIDNTATPALLIDAPAISPAAGHANTGTRRVAGGGGGRGRRGAPAWLAEVACASGARRERAIGASTSRHPNPIRGMGGSRSPRPERACRDRQAMQAPRGPRPPAARRPLDADHS